MAVSYIKEMKLEQRNSFVESMKQMPNYRFQTPLVLENITALFLLHLGCVYGFYLVLSIATWKTVFWTSLLVQLGNIGNTAGSHRLWSHRSYKAKLPLRVILMIFQTITFQKSIFEWARNHRTHHKFTHSDGDPHNPERGFFYAHIGWLMLRKHKDVITKGNAIDTSDLENDPVTKFQRKYYYPLVVLLSFVIPAVVPRYFWGENLRVCLFVPTFVRFVISVHVALSINSIAHVWGTRPYDKAIGPADNAFLSFLVSGEGWHNYHHVFPWDYKTGELGSYRHNITTMVIDFFWAIGWAYDLKTATVEMVNKRKQRTGSTDTIYKFQRHLKKDAVSQWGEEDIPNEEEEAKKCVKICG